MEGLATQDPEKRGMVYTNLNAASGSIKTAKQCLELSSGRAMLGMCVKGGTNWKK